MIPARGLQTKKILNGLADLIWNQLGLAYVFGINRVQDDFKPTPIDVNKLGTTLLLCWLLLDRSTSKDAMSQHCGFVC